MGNLHGCVLFLKRKLIFIVITDNRIVYHDNLCPFVNGAVWLFSKEFLWAYDGQ